MGDFSLSSSLSSSDLEMGLYRYTHKTENYSAMESSHTPMAPSFFVEDLANEEPHHFLEFCSLCKKPLGSNHDIYMYRGDTPFCSEECRQEQIEMDEALEKKPEGGLLEEGIITYERSAREEYL